MEALERAVRVSTDGGASEAARQEAAAYLESVRRHADGWAFCLDAALQPATADDVRFVCLQVVCDAVAAGRVPAERLGALQAQLEAAPAGVLAARACAPFVKNKLAQTLLAVLARRGAREWPALVDRLLDAAGRSAAGLDFLLRVLSLFSDTVDRSTLGGASGGAGADAGRDYATQTKDVLREGSVQRLAQFWYAVITAFGASEPALVNTTLATMRDFIAWIDVGLVANAQFVPLLLRLLLDPQYTAAACDCVAALVCKGMDPAAKVDLVAQLRLPDVVAAFSASRAAPAFAAAFARLLATAALELAFAADKLQGMSDRAPGPLMDASRRAEAVLDALVPTLLAFYAHPDADISDPALDFFQPYVTKFKAGAFRGPVRTDRVQQILPVLLKKAAYPPDYFATHRLPTTPAAATPAATAAADDDDDDAFVETRRRTGHVFRALVRIDPETTTAFVEAAVADVCTNTAARSFADIEAALYLFFLLGEGTISPEPPTSASSSGSSTGATTSSGPIPEAVKRCVEQHAPRMLQMVVVQSGVSQHPHPVVVLMFFEIVVRYVRLVAPEGSSSSTSSSTSISNGGEGNTNACLAAALAAFFDARGMRHAEPAVRHRVMSLFQKFVRSSRTQLHAYAAQILANLQPVIALRADVQQSYPFDDQLCVYESLGYLIGSRPRDTVALLEAFMRPLLARLAAVLQDAAARTGPGTGAGDADAGAAAAAALVRQHLNAVTVFSKGFVLNQSDARDAALAAPFVQVLELALAALRAFPADPSVWTHVATYLHRVIDVGGTLAVACVGPSLAALYARVEALAATRLPTPDAQQAFFREAAELLSLEGQVSSRLKARARGVCEPTVARTVRLVAAVVAPALARAVATAPRSEEARELFDATRLVAQAVAVMLRDSPAVVVALAEMAATATGDTSTANTGSNTSVFGEVLQFVTLTLQSPDPAAQRGTVRFYLAVLATFLAPGTAATVPQQQAQAQQAQAQGALDVPAAVRDAVTEFLCTVAAPALLRTVARQHLPVGEGATRKYLQDVAAFFLALRAAVPSFADYFGQTLLPPHVADPATRSQFVLALAQSPEVFLQGLHYLTNL